MQYCRFVHAHHGAEDRLLFPALRAANPAIGPVVDRLEADRARALTDTDGEVARRRVVDGLDDLRVHLLEHLEYEEEEAGPTMRRLERLG